MFFELCKKRKQLQERNATTKAEREIYFIADCAKSLVVL